MQLIVILLATVSILTFFFFSIVFFGSSKGDRARSAWYFAAAIFATAWMASIATFMIATPDRANVIGWHVNWTFISAILLDIAFLGYGVWEKKYGKITTGYSDGSGSYTKSFEVNLSLEGFRDNCDID